MSRYIGESGHDEHGRYIGGAAGDQSGTECYYHLYYNYPWDRFFEPISTDFGNKIANNMIDACKNSKIGYDQGQRNSAYAQYKKVGSISKISTPCEVDCSSLVSLCVTAAGCDILSMRSNAPVTSTLRSVLMATGKFKEVSKPTKRGTICLSTGNHTAIYLGESTAKVSSSTKTSTTTTKPADKKKSTDEIAKEVIAGKWGTGEDRKKKLKAAGYDCATIQSRVNALLSKESAPKYFKKFSNGSIVMGLKSIGENSSFSYRTKIAKANGIKGYIGTAAQNTKLCDLAKKGKLIIP